MIKKAILFIFAGIPGLCLFLFSSMALTFLFMEERWTNYLQAIIFIMLIPVGAVLTLIGVGKLRQWLYILPFLAFPISTLCSAVLSSKLHMDPNNEWMLLGFVLGPIIIFFFVRSYYQEWNS
jgi:hypothetical protein